MLTKWLATAAVVLCSAPKVSGENIFYPGDAGVIDVTKAPYNAIPNDGNDDAPAIQRALNEHVSGNHVFYFPNGSPTDALNLKSGDVLVARVRGDGRNYYLNLYVPSRRIAYSWGQGLTNNGSDQVLG